MKIAYVAEWDAFGNSGVLTKIKAQITQWEKNGHEVKVFMISSTYGDRKELDDNFIVFFSKFMKKTKNGFAKKLFNRLFNGKKIFESVKEFSPNMIYYRQNSWYPFLIKTLNIAPCIMELNTDDLSEMQLFGFFKRNLYLLGRKKIIHTCSAFVSVSNEIATLYKKYKKPIEIISNGFDFTNFKIDKLVNFQKSDNYKPQLIFVGTPDMSWHGVDIYLKLASLLPEFEFHLVGPVLKATPINVHQHGYLNKNKLYDLYKCIDIGVGTLALFRKKMKEASPLKTREYAAFGLPMIVGYWDTDLHDFNSVLQINTGSLESEIDNLKIFIKSWSGKRIEVTRYSSILDYKTKEEKRLNFFKQVITNYANQKNQS
jgi:hypothetical protein